MKGRYKENLSGSTHYIKGIYVHSTRDSFTPLLLAASCGHAEAIQTLLDNGADVEAVDKDDKTAVFWCAQQGSVEALEVRFSTL